MPRSQLDGLADALGVFEARRALWESIGAWEDSVALWRSTPFAQLDIHAEVPIAHPVTTAHAAHVCVRNAG